MIVEKIREEKAITLPALVIQIILILIIAGISITTISSSGGILETALTTVSAYEQAEIREKVKLKLLNLKMEKISQNKNVSLQDILELKNSDDEVVDAYELNGNVVIRIEKYECVIDANLEIQSINIYNPAQIKLLTRRITS